MGAAFVGSGLTNSVCTRESSAARSDEPVTAGGVGTQGEQRNAAAGGKPEQERANLLVPLGIG
jgi:hypothetical protein